VIQVLWVHTAFRSDFHKKINSSKTGKTRQAHICRTTHDVQMSGVLNRLVDQSVDPRRCDSSSKKAFMDKSVRSARKCENCGDATGE
jgi:hypothetical protein